VQPPDSSDRGGEAAAAEWLARIDRGLTPAEQDAYLQWLQQSEENARALGRLERCWDRLDALRQWRPQHSAAPNADLLRARRRRRWRPWLGFALAAAVGATLAVLSWWRPSGTAPAPHVFHRGPEKMVLTDGSMIELNAESRVEVQFTPRERRVRLVKGDAHFAVAKNPARPFVVAAGDLRVQAVGTAFAVQTGGEKLSVVVTEGRVRLDAAARDPAAGGLGRELLQAVAGQEVVLDPPPGAGAETQCHVRDLTPAELDAALAWRALRLEFLNDPLRDAVAELNRFSARKLTLADAATGDILIAGSFRADNVDAFVRLLELGFGVTAESRGDEIVLRRR
jgi:transmembrane sensor